MSLTIIMLLTIIIIENITITDSKKWTDRCFAYRSNFSNDKLCLQTYVV